MDYVRECFVLNLKIRRKIMRMSQENLAEAAEVSSGYIANIETGRNFPSTQVILKLAKALNVDHWNLFVDPRKEDIGFSKDEVFSIIDNFKNYLMGELPKRYPSKVDSDGQKS
ncbi:MAG: helix-turn-helix domain-containing protein [Spirochaetia bacterium]|nr:helix-turn-helix domain-containing protein [Spirochaetia bacterium]